MARKRLPPIQHVREALDYDPVSGVFRWRERPLEHFISPQRQMLWNARWAGKIAGSVKEHGYVAICLSKKMCYGHRLAFLLVNGRYPIAEIDHIDGNRANNRIGNLREASRAQNGRNIGIKRTNSSGVTGVQFNHKLGKFTAAIMYNRRQIHIGCFDTIEEAASARRATAKRMFGKFARHE